jgi:hypothetical protein
MKYLVKLFILMQLSASFIFPTVSFGLPSDFLSPLEGWVAIQSKDHTGEQKLLALNNQNDKEKIYLYWMGPFAETQIQDHQTSEEVAIVQGSLYWLNEDKSIQKILNVGDYVNRKPGVKHGPFRSGPSGCLMYVKFH